MKKVLFLLPLLFTNCASYYDSIDSTNQSIAESNSEIAQACADAIESANGDAASIVALSLTICQRHANSIIPEGPSEIIAASGNAVMKGLIPVAAIEISRSSGGNTDVEGDYTHNNGAGTADASRSVSHTEIAPETEE